MRYPADYKEKTRTRILEAAAVVFRRQGLHGGSVDDVMREVGLTAGGFYAHFPSKEALFCEALIHTLRQARVLSGKEDESSTGAERIRAIVKKYLSPGHRRLIDQGCMMPPLLAELPRAGVAAQQAFETLLQDLVQNLAPHLPGEEGNPPADQALALVALLIGGMTLARAVADEPLADRILAACRQLLDPHLEPPPETRSPKRNRRSRSRPKGESQ